MVDGLSKDITRKTVVDKTDLRKSTSVGKSIAGTDASQLYPYSMCHPLPTSSRQDRKLMQFSKDSCPVRTI